jgi:hypothetical protein
MGGAPRHDAHHQRVIGSFKSSSRISLISYEHWARQDKVQKLMRGLQLYLLPAFRSDPKSLTVPLVDNLPCCGYMNDVDHVGFWKRIIIYKHNHNSESC